jgi:CDP-diacylglycerol--glycerol-3-phosphate 3-phosphatidyltransferase
MRYLTGGLTSRIGRFLWAIDVHPDVLTLLGVVIVAIAGVVAAHGELFWAAVLIMVGGSFDALDGAVARAMKRDGKFGALWDSTLDRYSDAFIFMGLAVHFSRQDDEVGLLLAMVTLLGALLVSYVRARASGLKVDCEVGLFTRMERVFLILAMLISGYVKLGLWILAIGTHLTVAQRVWHVRRTLKQRGDDTP